jgi:hypothetical protein
MWGRWVRDYELFASFKLHLTYRTLLDYRHDDCRLKKLSAVIALINIDMHINDHLGRYEHEGKSCARSSKLMSLSQLPEQSRFLLPRVYKAFHPLPYSSISQSKVQCVFPKEMKDIV